jgi:hypothetical protein
MKKLALFTLMALSLQVQAQNVGIGNPAPAERLDVNGNINVTGTIKANGVAGAQNQVLTTNASGGLAWEDGCQYKNFVSISSLLTTTWVPPAGITRILVEAWGAGGGGNIFAGGGGGGYIKAQFDLTPSSVISLAIGDGGSAATSATAANGTSTSFTVTEGSTPKTISAFFGSGALYLSSTNGQGGFSGSYSATSNLSNHYIGYYGQPGQSADKFFYQYNATTFYEKGIAGRGGNAANTSNTGGLGQTYLVNNTTSTLIQRNGNPTAGSLPGGGGASGIQFLATSLIGGVGANGLIIIHY